MAQDGLEKQKEELREKMKQLRDGIAQDVRDKESAALTDMIVETELYKNARFVLSYVSFGSETDTRALIRRAIKDQKKVYCPAVEGDVIHFYAVSDLDALKPGAFGIPEPEKNPALLFPYDIHLSLDRAEECVIFVPGLAFDRKLHRIGYGKGYFDRYLSGFRKKMAVGLSFSEQIVDEVPAGDTDTALDLVVTPTGAYY